MTRLKMLALAAMAVAGLMNFTGSASASPSYATSPAETVYTGPVHMTAGTTEWHNAVTTITCTSSTMDFKVERHKGSSTSTTAGGHVSTFTLSNCNYPMTVLKKGSISINSAGTVFWTGFELTIHGPFGVNCILTTNNTDIGTITGGAPAKLDINSRTIPRTGHSAFCGWAWTWTGSYNFTTPSPLFIS